MVKWLKTMLSENGGASTKRVAYMIVVVSAIVWLSVDLRHGIGERWLAAFNSLLFLAGSGYLGGKAVNALPGAAAKKEGEA
jgi:hypothetical protein